MEKLEGFVALPPEWQATLRQMRSLQADLSSYYALVQNLSVEVKIIVFYYAFGKKKKIARLLRTSPKRVRRVVDYFIANHAIPDPLPIGRPSKKTPAVVARIQSMVVANHSVSIIDIQRELVQQGIELSYGTVQSILHELGFQYKPPKQRQKLTEEQIQKRIRFGFSIWTCDLFQWPIIFSDESRFALGSDCRWVWRRRGDVDDSVFSDKVKFPISVMVWAAIGPGFRSDLIFLVNSVNGSEYVRVLKDSQLFEKADETYGEGMYLFQQDGAPAHTAASTIRWISGRANVLNHWPPNSPDLNPIEHVWGIMKRRLRILNPQTKEDLINCLQVIWDSIPQEVFDRLVESMRYRIHLMLVHGGLAIGPYLRHEHTGEPLVFPSPGTTEIYDDLVLGPDLESSD